MFDAVLERSVAAGSLAGSLAVALGLHVLLFGISLVLPTRSAPLARQEEVYFTLWSPPVPTTPPETAAGASDPLPAAPASGPEPERVSKPRGQAHAAALARTPPTAPDTIASAPPVLSAGAAPSGTADPSASPGASGGLPSLAPTAAVLPGAVGNGGAVAGAGAGTGDGHAPSAGQGAGTPSAAMVLPFGEGMSRPVLLAKIDPTYTREALAARIEGSMLVKCVITAAGSLRGCRVVKGLPHMDEAVLRALAQWRYRPATYQGGPVTVDYVIPVRLVLP